MKSITHHMARLWLILLIAPLVAFAPENAAARSFSGGSHTTGGGRTTSRSNPSSTFRSYQTPKSETPRSGTDRVQQKKYRINRDNNRQTRYQSYRSQPRQGGIMSDFGRSLTRGIGWGVGWSIGSHMGNSLWHTMFGFGNNTYYDQDGRMQTQSGGFAGWFILILLIIIIVVVVKLLRRSGNNYRRHEY
ncbi:hypothetical protein [Leuconostoc citreum]